MCVVIRLHEVSRDRSWLHVSGWWCAAVWITLRQGHTLVPPPRRSRGGDLPAIVSSRSEWHLDGCGKRGSGHVLSSSSVVGV